MEPNRLSLGGLIFERQGKQIVLRSPEGSVETDLLGFLRGVKHLLTMGMDLEGEAELNGGFVFRVQGERVRLKLGRYTETFPLENVAALFQRLATEWMVDP
jgi:hypothetical protein